MPADGSGAARWPNGDFGTSRSMAALSMIAAEPQPRKGGRPRFLRRSGWCAVHGRFGPDSRQRIRERVTTAGNINRRYESLRMTHDFGKRGLSPIPYKAASVIGC